MKTIMEPSLASVTIGLFAAYGLANAISEEYVGSFARNFVYKYFPNSLFYKAMTCVTCCAFWTGLIIASVFGATPANILLFAIASSGFSKSVLLLSKKNEEI